MWAIAGTVIAVALIHFLTWEQTGWLLVLGSVLALCAAARRSLNTNARREALRTWLGRVDPTLRWTLLGATLLFLGLLTRFTPEDVGWALIAAGLIVLVVGVLLLFRSDELATVLPAPTAPEAIDASSRGDVDVLGTLPTRDDPLALSVDGYTRLAEEFRWRVTEAVFQHARRASRMIFLVGLTFFGVGIGLFVWLAYSVLQRPPTEDFAATTQRYLEAFGFVRSGASLEQLVVLGVLAAANLLGQIVPAFGLLVVAIIGSRLIVSATRLSQRKVIQETLAELGPLQATLAGIPPRKPMTQVIDQSLRHTQSAFRTRLLLSQILFGIGIVLLITTVVYALQNGAGSYTNLITTGIAGGSGIVAFIFSQLASRQGEIGRTLDDITRQETTLAERAQRSEIVDVWIAQLARSGTGMQSVSGLAELLSVLNDSPHRSALSSGRALAAVGKNGEATNHTGAHTKLAAAEPTPSAH